MWNGNCLSADIRQARCEREAKEAFLSSLRTRVPTADEFALAQRKMESISKEPASKEKKLRLAKEKFAPKEAKERALEMRMCVLQQQLREVRKKNDEFRSDMGKVKAGMDALKNELVRHENVVKCVEEEEKKSAAELNLPPSAAAADAQAQQDDANVCPICCENAINASFRCGHRFCRTCADRMFQSAKKECPNCRKRIKCINPSY